MRVRVLLCIVVVLATFSAVLAQGTPPPSDLLIYNVWVRPTAPTPADGATPEPPIPGTVTGAYMTIENTGSQDYQLVSIADNLAEMSMLHQMTMDSKGVMRMQMIDKLDIPAGKTVVLGPESYHVMLMNVSHDIYDGQTVALTLTFADASGATQNIPVAAMVTDDPPAADPLIAANTLAQTDPTDPQALDVSLTFDNQDANGDTLNGASSPLGGKAELMHSSQSGIAPFDAIFIPSQSQTLLTPDTAFIRLSDLTPLPADAFPLTLTFSSGKTLTFAVPVQQAGVSDEPTATSTSNP